MAKDITSRLRSTASDVTNALRRRRAEPADDPPDDDPAAQIAQDQLEQVAASVPVDLESVTGDGAAEPDQFAISTPLGGAGSGREALADRIGSILGDAEDSADDAGSGFGREQIAKATPAGTRAEQGVAFLDRDGAVTKVSGGVEGGDDGLFLGFDVSAMANEAQMNRVMAEREASGEEDSSPPAGGADSGAGASGSGSSTGGGGESPAGTTEIQNDDGSTTTVYDDGTIVTASPDGTVEVNHPDGTIETTSPDGTHTEEYPDGSTSTVHPDGTVTETPPTDPPPDDPPPDDADDDPETSIPDDDSQFTLPPALQGILDRDIAALGQHRGSQEGGDVDPSEDSIDFGAGSGPIPDLRERLLGGDVVDPNDPDFGGSGGAIPSDGLGGDDGVTDPIDDGTSPPQTSGPSERATGGQIESAPDTGSGDPDEADGSADAVVVPPLFGVIDGPVSRFDVDRIDFPDDDDG